LRVKPSSSRDARSNVFSTASPLKWRTAVRDLMVDA
jgi:hypothetical protein